MNLAPLLEVIDLRLRDYENSFESLRLEVVELLNHVRRIIFDGLHSLDFHNQVRVSLRDTNDIRGARYALDYVLRPSRFSTLRLYVIDIIRCLAVGGFVELVVSFSLCPAVFSFIRTKHGTG